MPSGGNALHVADSSDSIAQQLGKWRHNEELQIGAVSRITDVQRRKKNDNFLAQLSAVEQQEQQKAQQQQQQQESAAGTNSVPAAESMAKPIGQPKEKRKARLKGAGLEAASELFWSGDQDANAGIDREEWGRLVEQTGRSLSVSVDEAFDRADKDGDGLVDWREWLDTKEAAHVAGNAAAEAAWNGNVPEAISADGDQGLPSAARRKHGSTSASAMSGGGGGTGTGAGASPGTGGSGAIGSFGALGTYAPDMDSSPPANSQHQKKRHKKHRRHRRSSESTGQELVQLRSADGALLEASGHERGHSHGRGRSGSAGSHERSASAGSTRERHGSRRAEGAASGSSSAEEHNDDHHHTDHHHHRSSSRQRSRGRHRDIDRHRGEV